MYKAIQYLYALLHHSRPPKPLCSCPGEPQQHTLLIRLKFNPIPSRRYQVRADIAHRVIEEISVIQAAIRRDDPDWEQRSVHFYDIHHVPFELTGMTIMQITGHGYATPKVDS